MPKNQMKNFYQSIANNYNYIFPPNPVQAEFVNSSLEINQKKNILDVGCGTGNLSFAIAEFAENVIGIDLDSEMLSIAKNRVKTSNKKIEFKNLNMLEIQNSFNHFSFDSIVSFGNTLVHLNDLEEIKNFFKQTKKIVKSNGKLLLQIINYDHIIKEKIKGLPTIENEHIKFERVYIHHDNQRKIDFNTKLTIKKDNLVIENSIKLFPVLKDEIQNLLKEAGYNKINFYSNFNKKSYTEESIPLIIEAN